MNRPRSKADTTSGELILPCPFIPIRNSRLDDSSLKNDEKIGASQPYACFQRGVPSRIASSRCVQRFQPT